MQDLHAHITTAARDCDGDYQSGYVYPMSTDEMNSNFPEIEFKERVIASIISVVTLSGTLDIESERVHYHEQTEEGYRSSTAEWCEDPTCLNDSPWQRDLRAESMGY